jgi:hypothetical protein
MEQEFIALLICAVWEKLRADGARQTRKRVHASDTENRDRCALLRIVRSQHFDCFDGARTIRPIAKDECDSREESRGSATGLDCSGASITVVVSLRQCSRMPVESRNGYSEQRRFFRSRM